MLHLLIAFFLSANWSLGAALSEGHTWLVEQPFLESIFPLEGYSGIRARSHEELYVDKPESWFCIDHDLDGRLVAEIRVPKGSSIGEQLTWGWIEDRTRTFDDLRPTLSLNRLVIPASACPAVQEALARLRRLDIPVDPRETHGILDPRDFELDVAGYDQALRISVSYPEHVVARWYEETLKGLLACAASLPKSEIERLGLPAPGAHICGTDYGVP